MSQIATHSFQAHGNEYKLSARLVESDQEIQIWLSHPTGETLVMTSNMEVANDLGFTRDQFLFDQETKAKEELARTRFRRLIEHLFDLVEAEVRRLLDERTTAK